MGHFLTPSTVNEEDYWRILKKRKKIQGILECCVVCQGQTNSDIPAQNKPGEEDSLMSVWLRLLLQPSVWFHRQIWAYGAAKGQNSSLLEPGCLMRQMFGFERSSAACSSLPFTAILRHWAGKKPVMVFSLSTAGTYHSLSWSCCFKSTWVCLHIPSNIKVCSTVLHC